MSDYQKPPFPGAQQPQYTTQQQPADYTNYVNYAYEPRYAENPQYPQPYYQQAPTAQNTTSSLTQGWFNFQDHSYLKGVAVGAGVALIVANPTVQKAVVSGAVKIWSALQGGVEEVKEQINDIRAEMSQED